MVTIDSPGPQVGDDLIGPRVPRLASHWPALTDAQWSLCLSPGATHSQRDEHGDVHLLRLQPPRCDLLVAGRGQDLQHGVPGERVSDQLTQRVLSLKV